MAWKSKSKHDPNQYRLDFESAGRERFALLISALEAAHANEKVRSVVLLVFNMTRDGGTLRWSLARIADEFGRTRDTARRWIRSATGLGFLEVDERRHVGGGQRCHALSIDWEGVRRLACSPERTGVSEIGGRRSEVGGRSPPLVGVAKQRTGVAKQRTGVAKQRTGVADLPPPNRKSIPLSIPLSIQPSDGVRNSWSRVEGILRKRLGMGAAAPACLAMRERGATCDDLVALVRHYESKPGAWGIGGLYLRMQRWRPGQRASEAWPPESEAYGLRRERESRERNSESFRAEAESQAQLEMRWGPVLDAMSAAETGTMAAELFGGNALMQRMFARGGVRSPLVRELLLAELVVQYENQGGE